MTNSSARNATAPQLAAARHLSGVCLPSCRQPPQEGQPPPVRDRLLAAWPGGPAGRSVSEKGPVEQAGVPVTLPVVRWLPRFDQRAQTPASSTATASPGRHDSVRLLVARPCGWVLTNDNSPATTGDRQPEGISSVADLKGKSASAPRRHGSDHYLLLLVLLYLSASGAR